MPPDS